MSQKMCDLTLRIKSDLWARFSTHEHPSEWDGINYGGGKLSQRFWEYFKAVELLDLKPGSVLLDIGGGSPKTGFGFFASLLKRYIRKIIVLDPNMSDPYEEGQNVIFIREAATFSKIKLIFKQNRDLTHISSISVFEHVAPSVRKSIIQAINEFRGDTFVTTLEYHARRCFFEHQLTAQTVHDLFEPFTNFYLTDFHASPVLCGNSRVRSVNLPVYNRWPSIVRRIADAILYKEIPGWYPIALKYVRNNSHSKGM